MRYLWFLAIVLAPVTARAEEGAIAPPSLFKCDPPSFTLRQEKDGYHLEGAFEVPTAGYGYQFEQTPTGLVLHVTPPKGMAAEVISTLTVTHVLPPTPEITELKVDLDRSFNWGITGVTCRIVG